MNNIREKLIDCLMQSSGYSKNQKFEKFSEEIDYYRCEAGLTSLADDIVKNLPDILDGSEWIKLPEDINLLPRLIPLIKIKDNFDGEERYFGRDYHDSLVVENNQLSYYDLQCGDGTVYKNKVSEGEGFTFVTEPDSYMNSIELIDIKEYLKVPYKKEANKK